MLISVLSGFIVAILFLFTDKWLTGKRALLASLLPAGLFLYYISLAPEVVQGEKLVYTYPWLPSLGIRLDFTVDGLSLLFCLLITGIGALVFLYASAYMKGHRYPGRFFGYLSMFMASMLGLVLCDNVIALFVFWELTSISSFFLIGFDYKNAAARKSALLALAVTWGGGFLLLAAFVLMGNITNSYSILEMINHSTLLKEHGLYPLILVLVLAGAFTKSAQFPFHFWLPAAMKAPTPVSAYLHSATMVKAGIYLVARLTPVLGNTEAWNHTLLAAGGITMLYAAFQALFRTDLKIILAYATISALGMLIFLLGIGTQQALLAAAVYILVHALYKAGLFLTAGILDHETGTRNVAKLSGMRKVMPLVAIAGVLAALSGAGIPFTIGYIGKELIYEGALHAVPLPAVLTGAAVLTNILLLYALFVAGIKPFAGKLPAPLKKAHLPPVWMWLPPLLPGLCGLFFGIFPGTMDQWLAQPAVIAMQDATADSSLKIWHGFNMVLLLSIITLVAGLILFFVLKPAEKRKTFINRFNIISPRHLLLRSAGAVQLLANWYTKLFQHSYLRNYILIIVAFITALLSYKLFAGVQIYIDSSKLHEITIYEAAITGIMLIAITTTLFTASRLVAVASLGVVGYCICLLFVFYSAPDLAMTQFTIDTLTVVLFILVLFRLPHFLKLSNVRVKIRDGLVALAFGALLSITALEVLNEPVDKEISEYYAKNAYTLAKGRNVVNVILVDFRSLDTMAEITVLTIAAIGVYSLLKLKINSTGNE